MVRTAILPVVVIVIAVLAVVSAGMEALKSNAKETEIKTLYFRNSEMYQTLLRKEP